MLAVFSWSVSAEFVNIVNGERAGYDETRRVLQNMHRHEGLSFGEVAFNLISVRRRVAFLRPILMDVCR